jgi:mono/diheme cytochrome c family protein
MNMRFAIHTIVLPVALLISPMVLAGEPANKSTLERGRYLVTIGGCNDCHTPGYPEAAGQLAPGEWLTGSAVGFNGPWGTTYPANLRLVVQSMSEAQWLKHARSATRPPMPWFNLRDTNDADLRAMYHFIRSLGAKGEPAPTYVPPEQAVNTPYIVFVPKNMPKQASAAK